MAGGSRHRDSRAIVFEGDVLEVNRCWFEGFDEAIEVALLKNNAIARIQQTMIVPSPPRTPFDAQTSEWHGWGLLVRLISEQQAKTKTASAQLVLDHCTIEGSGMVDLTNSPSSASLEIAVRHCAIKVEALLASKSKIGEPLTRRIHWSGTGNQYDIFGRDWVVLSAHQGTPASSVAVNDLSSWLKVADERDASSAKLTYQIDPAVRSIPLTPRDFAIKHSGSRQSQPGADPDLVGPSSNP